MTASVVLRTLGFILAFTLEVRVHAAEVVQLPNSAAPQQEPPQCLTAASTCAVRTRPGEKFKFKWGDSTVHMDQETVVIRQSSDKLRFVTGTVWVVADSAFRVITEFGETRTGGPGEFWITRGDDRVTVVATEGSVLLAPRGSPEELLVEPGCENWLGKVTRQGRAETGIPMPVNFSAHVERWARLYPRTARDFEKDVRRFHSVWLEASQRSALIHKELFDRKVASIEGERARRMAARQKAEAKSRALQEIFRRKVFEGE